LTSPKKWNDTFSHAQPCYTATQVAACPSIRQSHIGDVSKIKTDNDRIVWFGSQETSFRDQL